ncbi:cysteine protease StiP family protein [Oceanisphaera ostreae]|uniref:Cysteine protease StiP family protein n=1 Tax=Oceanisphaera ostreae TaxID=914151 RepID=A0ABW3KKM3_9GAMM
MPTTAITPFSGSYQPEDVQFLLQPLEMAYTPVAEKEQLIQSGQSHYSDMLSQEPAPSDKHKALFNQALDEQGFRLAKESVALAKALQQQVAGEQATPIILVSLVRAGVPLGVILQQTLREMGVASVHYGISIIRDRGIDEAALAYIEAKHGTQGIVFVDGWTGKGAITDELAKNLAGRPGYPEQPRLVVLADPGGSAWLSASSDDWLIPFGILGAPVSGLVSRSIWTDKGVHGCVLCDHLAADDCSEQLADVITEHRKHLNLDSIAPALLTEQQGRVQPRLASRAVIQHIVDHYQVDSINRIKPGIAEATRAVLRRVPDHVLVRSLKDPDVELLVHLAQASGVVISEVGDNIGPYRALTIIKKVL